jgi:hypothetical protein
MQRLTVVVIAVAMSSACLPEAERAVGRVSTGTSGVAFLVAGVTAFSPEDHQIAKIAAITGGVLLGVGLIMQVDGQRRIDIEDDARQERLNAEMRARTVASNEARARAAQRRNRAWSITKLIAESARAGDCQPAIAHDAELRDLDAEFHATVSVRDPAIGGCLAKAGISIPPPIEPPPPPRDRIKDREQAFRLTKTAADAARTGNCGAALASEGSVRDLDANVYDAWFVRDSAIKRCLAAGSGQ